MKTIFVMNVENTIGLITNSSSELFVLKGQTKDIVEQMLSNVYSDWRNEYCDVKNISDLSPHELDTFFQYACSAHMWPASRNNYPVLKGFTFDELYEEDKESNLTWNGQIQYRLKSNDMTFKYGPYVTDDNFSELVGKLCPEKNMWFLFSKDENPDWEMQQRLENIADRYHLG
jgi:hypothetical protein